MKTTSTDDTNLAEIADLLVDIENTHQELKSKIDSDSSPSVSWIPSLAVAATAVSFGLITGAAISRGRF